MLMVAPNTIESVPITVHVVPFGETEAAIVFPLRTSLYDVALLAYPTRVRSERGRRRKPGKNVKSSRRK